MNNTIWEIEHVNLFKALCPHKYKEYVAHHSFKYLKKNEFVYFEGDSANKVFFIAKGKIMIGYYTDDGTEVIKSILRKGEVFGERAILGLHKRSDFARSIDSDTRVCVVSKEMLLDMMKSSDAITLSVYKLIGLRIKKVERRLEILLFKDTKTRLLEFLEDLKKECPIEHLDGKMVVSHPYTQSDIAKLIGTSRPTLNILLNELRDSGQIDFQRNKIYFL